MSAHSTGPKRKSCPEPSLSGLLPNLVSLKRCRGRLPRDLHRRVSATDRSQDLPAYAHTAHRYRQSERRPESQRNLHLHPHNGTMGSCQHCSSSCFTRATSTAMYLFFDSTNYRTCMPRQADIAQTPCSKSQCKSVSATVKLLIATAITDTLVPSGLIPHLIREQSKHSAFNQAEL